MKDHRMLNRQTRRKGWAPWTDRGAVTIADAAIAESQLHDVEREPIEVEVRDSSTPETIYAVKVRQERRFVVEGLRGPGEYNADTGEYNADDE